MPDAVMIAGLLAEPARRRVVAALVLGATTLDEVRAATGLSAREAGTALARLVAGELVLDDGKGAYYIIDEAFALAAQTRGDSSADERAIASGLSDEAARVVRAFVRDGRLVSIPTQHSKRLVILDMLAQEFEPGRRYKEREVNAALRKWHADFAALRRYLVDDGFLDRDRNEYWRSGGTVTE